MITQYVDSDGDGFGDVDMVVDCSLLTEMF